MKTRILKALEWLTRLVQGWGTAEVGEHDQLTLLPLTPKYVRANHGLYLDLIERALADREEPVRNVALTGSYGVGKSSILEKLADQHPGTSLSISLSSVGPATEAQASVAAKESPAASSKTNRIQKEIVKQLLYSQDPASMPGSGYRRVSQFRWWRALPSSMLLALPITVVFLLAGWSLTIAQAIGLPKDQIAWIHPILFGASTFLIWLVRAVFHNRIYVEKLSAGAATISLSPTSATYFDEYLDEIVYFFEVNKCDLVIFEDIDRFDDAHIFETLRSLNSILNKAQQLNGRRIRFVYAIKDSIFERLGAPTDQGKAPSDPAPDELARSNRTKFFDLVVPVVPFVTHRSARDLFDETLKGVDHEVSSKLFDLAARHLADMRLIKNIRNEFVIFKSKIIDQPGSVDLEQTNLFAMMIYKSNHLEDFELIKLGTSKLDLLYKTSRKLINTHTARLNREIAGYRTALTRVQGVTGRGEALGSALGVHIDVLLELISGTRVQYTFRGEPISRETLSTDEFWGQLIEEGLALDVTYRQVSYGQQSFQISRDQAALIVGDPLNTEAWVEGERQRLQNAIDVAISDRSSLAHADMRELILLPAFKAEYAGEERSFLEIAESILPSELAAQLVRSGYIDRNFTLYTSTFHTNRLTPNAANFIMKNVEPNIVDTSFPLGPRDAEAILLDYGEVVLSQRAALNVTLVDYLFSRKPPLIDRLATQLLRYGDDERAFLDAYVEVGKYSARLIRTLAPKADWIFRYLITDGTMDDATRLKLVDIALENAHAELPYQLGIEAKEYLSASCADLPVTTTKKISVAQADVIAGVLERSGVVVTRLDGLSRKVVDAIVSRDGYELTRSNVLIALGDPKHSMSLNAIEGSRPDVYRRSLRELPKYLEALKPSESSVDDTAVFSRVLNEAADVNEDYPSAIVQRASAACTVEELNTVAARAWPALVASDRAAPSLTNVRSFAEEFGLDSSLAHLLSTHGSITTTSEDAEADKLEFALKVLTASDVLPDPKLRALLVASLNLEDYLPATSIPTEPGELIGWLIDAEVVRDDMSTFLAVPNGDVDGRIFAISKSGAFGTFIDATLVPPREVGLIAQSKIVSPALKEQIVSRFTELTVGSDAKNLGMLAREAIALGKHLTVDETIRLATEKVRTDTVVALLKPHLEQLSEAQLTGVLADLGGKYKELAARNGRHPRIPNSPENQALVDRLIGLRLAKSSSVVRSDIKVNMKTR